MTFLMEFPLVMHLGLKVGGGVWCVCEFTIVRPHWSGVEMLPSALLPQPPVVFEPNFFRTLSLIHI